MRFSIVVLCSMMVLVACGSSSKKDDPTTNTPPNNNNTGGVESPPDVPFTEVDSGTNTAPPTTPPVAPKAPSNQAECIAVCETTYPAAAAKGKALDTSCFLGGVCEHVCNDLKPGTLVKPTEVDGGGCDTVKADSYPITTTSQACSDCLNTTPTCCTQWIAIFSSMDGRALNTCANQCYTNFKN